MSRAVLSICRRKECGKIRTWEFLPLPPLSLSCGISRHVETQEGCKNSYITRAIASFRSPTGRKSKPFDLYSTVSIQLDCNQRGCLFSLAAHFYPPRKFDSFTLRIQSEMISRNRRRSDSASSNTG